MLVKMLRGLTLAAGLVLAMGPAGADPAKGTAVDILFESKHLELMGKGAEVKYRLQRTVSDAKLLGEPFSDDIRIGVNAVEPDGKREVVIRDT